MRKKKKISFLINSSTELLYNYITAPVKLSEWLADNVISIGNRYIFTWYNYDATCFLIKKIPYKLVRYKWKQDFDNKYYFEFFIKKNNITKNVYLKITDFAIKTEIKKSKMWWKNRIKELKNLTKV
ncbi:START-like domain-containing protein [Candidatus Karelsulcia muelleri]|uniref:START-like domain-containing protein n=1 Tax=Candidatus Karelsulcia muelleri TaxID=336810 RepID=UPI00216B6213|nr:START-like domain-containing protein [Candidatus Karelsulcia muelleri]